VASALVEPCLVLVVHLDPLVVFAPRQPHLRVQVEGYILRSTAKIKHPSGLAGALNPKPEPLTPKPKSTVAGNWQVR